MGVPYDIHYVFHEKRSGTYQSSGHRSRSEIDIATSIDTFTCRCSRHSYYFHSTTQIWRESRSGFLEGSGCGRNGYEGIDRRMGGGDGCMEAVERGQKGEAGSGEETKETKRFIQLGFDKCYAYDGLSTGTSQNAKWIFCTG